MQKRVQTCLGMPLRIALVFNKKQYL